MGPNAPVPVEKHPFYLLFLLGVKIQHLGQKLEAETGISLTQWAILKVLVDRPTSSALSLARSVGIQPSTLTQALKRLEKKGLVHLGLDPGDSRRKNLSLAREGKAALDRADSWLSARLRALELGAEEIGSLRDRLLRIT